MAGADWIDLLNLIPADQHSQLNIITRTRVELSIDVILRTERNYLVYRGRVVGNTDEGRVFFTPYEEISSVYINRFVKEQEIESLFGAAPPLQSAADPFKDLESALAASSTNQEMPATGTAQATAPQPLPMQSPPAAPGIGSGLVPRLNTPGGIAAAKLAGITGSGMVPPLTGAPAAPGKTPTLIPPPTAAANGGDTPQPKGSILERLRAQRGKK